MEMEGAHMQKRLSGARIGGEKVERAGDGCELGSRPGRSVELFGRLCEVRIVLTFPTAEA